MKDKKALNLDLNQQALYGDVIKAQKILDKITPSKSWQRVLNRETGSVLRTTRNNHEEVLDLMEKIQSEFDGYNLSLQETIQEDGTFTLTVPTHVVYALSLSQASQIPAVEVPEKTNAPIPDAVASAPEVIEPNKKDEAGIYPFFSALRQGTAGTKTIQRIIEHPDFDPNQIGHYGYTPLQALLESYDFDTGMLLLSSENVRSKINPNNPLLLERAFLNNKPKVIKALLTLPQIDVNAIGVLGESILSFAIKSNDLEIIQLVLNNSKFDKKQLDTALSSAIKTGNIELVKLFLKERGADFNQVDNAGNTLFNYAISQGNPEIISLIKSYRSPGDRMPIDLPVGWSNQDNIISRASTLGECGLLKTAEDPLQVSFQSISETLAGIDGIILFNNDLYYVDQKQKKVEKILQSPENQANYDRLKLKFSASGSLTAVDNETLPLVASLIGHSPSGYKFDNEGVCFGISHMAMQALMADDYDNFYRRMQLITAIPVNRFNETITQLETKRTALTRQAWQEFKQLTAEDKNFLEKQNTEQIGLIKKEVADWKVKYSKTDLEAEKRLLQKKEGLLYNHFLDNKMGQEFSKDELLLLDTRALFEGITLYQDPKNEAELFTKATGQNVLSTAPIVQSQEMENKGGVIKITEFCGVYDKARLSQYFTGLQQAINAAKPVPDKNITLSLGNSKHRILVNFDPRKQKWSLIDPNNMSKPFSEENLIKAFSDNEITVFKTEIYSTEAERVALAPIIETWMQGESWKAAHRIDKNSADLVDSHGTHLIDMAISANQIETIQKLLQFPIDLQKPLSNGYTPLEYAMKRNCSPGIIKLLCDHPSMDPNQKFSNEYTPLQYALLMDTSSEIVRLLIDHPKIDLNLPDSKGRTALQYAVLFDKSPEIIEMLTEKQEMDKEIEAPVTTIFDAIQLDDLKSVKKFLSNPETEVNKQDKFGYTPLNEAIVKGNRVIIQALFNHKDIDPNQADKNGNTPFALIKRSNNKTLLKIIINHSKFDAGKLRGDEREFYIECTHNPTTFTKLKEDLQNIKGDDEAINRPMKKSM